MNLCAVHLSMGPFFSTILNLPDFHRDKLYGELSAQRLPAAGRDKLCFSPVSTDCFISIGLHVVVAFI